MSTIDKIFAEVSFLNSTEKLQLIDKILASLHPTNIGVETIWGNEAEERITAYNKEHVAAVDEHDVFTKYDK